MFALVVVGCALVISLRWVRRRRGSPFAVVLLELARELSEPGRASWVAAMLAECDAIPDRAERARFARGCVRAVLTAPAGPGAPSTLITGVVGVCIVTSAGLVAFGLVHYHGLRDGAAWIVYGALFALAMALYAVGGFQLAKFGSPLSHRAAVVAAGPAMLTSWYAASANGPASIGAAMGCVLLPAAAAVWAVRRDRRDRRDRRAASGVVASIATALITSLLCFIGFVGATYATSSRPTALLLGEFARSGVHDFRTWSVGDNLGGACFMLVFVPFVGSACGMLATKVAAR